MQINLIRHAHVKCCVVTVDSCGVCKFPDTSFKYTDTTLSNDYTFFSGIFLTFLRKQLVENLKCWRGLVDIVHFLDKTNRLLPNKQRTVTSSN